MNGVYVLVILLKNNETIVMHGKKYNLSSGYYCYVGSALGRGSTTIENRIKRHLKKEKKKFWNIDHITTLESSEIVSIFYAETNTNRECDISLEIYNKKIGDVVISKFGSHDCRKCPTHFYKIVSENLEDIRIMIKDIFRRLKLDIHEFPV